MNKSLSTPRGRSLNQFAKTLLLPVLLFLWGNVWGQCNNYQVYESIGTGLPTSGGTWTATSMVYGTTASTARTGTNYLVFDAAGDIIRTPQITNPGIFSFWYKRSSTATGTPQFTVETSPDNTNWIVRGATASVTETYTQFSVDLGALSLTNVYVRIRDTRASGTTQRYVDDISWTSTVSANNILIPSLANCSQTINSGTSYTFSDAGGSSDTYNSLTDQTITFTPSVSSEKVRLAFSAFNTESGYDGMVIYNGPNASSPIFSSGLAVGSSSTNCPAGSFYGTTSPATITSTDATGAITIRFRSDNGGNLAGWLATVTSVSVASCTTPDAPTLATNTVTSTGLNLVITPPVSNVPSGGYMVIRSTSATAPTLTNGTPYTGDATYTVVSNGTSNNIAQTGLASNTQYYYYVYSQNTGCTGAPYYSSVATISPITCAAAPTGVSVSAITSSGANFTWTPAITGGGAGTIISTINIYSNSGATTLVKSFPSVSSVYTLSDPLILPSTQYWYQIVSNNGNCGTAAATGTFTTACAATPITITQGFNSTSVPACWSVQFPSTSKISFLASGSNPTTSPQAGSHMVRYNSATTANGGAGTEERLMSLPISSTGATSVDLEFQWRNENSTSYNSGSYLNEGVQIQYSLDGSTWTNVSSAYYARYDATLPSGTAQWNKKTLTLPPAVANQSLFYIAFKFRSELGNNMFLDEVTIRQTPTDAVDYANIQYPGVSTTTTGTAVEIFGQAYEPGVTAGAGAGAGLQVWYSKNATDVDPSSAAWTGSWISATYHGESGNNDEWKGSITPISGQADTYYSFRYQLNGGPMKYGGYSTSGGGFWDGTTNKNGKLSVNYEVYTTAVTPTNTVNNSIDVYFKDYVPGSDFYTSGQTEIWMYAGARVGATTFNHTGTQNFGDRATLVKFVQQTDPTIYKATIKFADVLCVNNTTDIITGIDLNFQNQYYTSGGVGSNNQTANLFLDLGDATVSVSAPTIAPATVVATTTATINWTAPATGAIKGYDYYYSTTNTAPSAGTTPSGAVVGNVLTANLSSLSPATTYYYWVRTKGCDINSVWTSVATFTTTCVSISTFPWTENFDAMSAIGSGIVANCWKNVTGTKAWVSANASTDTYNDPKSAPNYMSIEYSNTTASQLWTPTFILEAGKSYDFSFYYNTGTYTTNTGWTGKLLVNNTQSVTGATELGTFVTSSQTTTGYVQYKHTFKPSSSGSYIFAVSVSSTFAPYHLGVDDFRLEETPPTLLANNGNSLSLTFADQAITTTSATQSFNLSGLMLTGAPGTITVSAPAGFEVSSVDNATWGSSTTVSYSSATLADKQVNVRFKPTECTPISNATLTISGGGATVIPTVSLSGTGIIPAPTATAGTLITDTSFTANWNAVPGATGYQLDVYEKVSTVAPELVTNGGFETGNTNGWTFGANLNQTISTTQKYLGAHSLNISSSHSSGNREVSQSISGLEIGKQYKMSLWYYADASSSNDAFRVWSSSPSVQLPSATGFYGSVKSSWQNIESTFTASATSHNFVLRFYTGARIYLDDISIKAVDNVETKTYVTNYNSKTVTGGSTISDVVTGLIPDTQYHYVVRAITTTCKSGNSNEINVKTDNTVVWNAGAWSNITGPSATLNAIVRAPFVVGANTAQASFTAKDLTVESTGSLEIPANQSITVAGNITTADNKIIIDSDGSLLQTNAPATNQNTGKIIAKRSTKMRKMDYTYWGTPVTGQKLLNTSGNANPALYNVGGFSEGTPNNRIYQYNEPNDTFKAATDANFVPAKAYAIRGKDRYLVDYPSNVPVADQFTFTGIANNGTYSVGIQKSKNTPSANPAEPYTHGYNMIGNPYPSNIDFIKFYNYDHGDGNKNSDHILGKAWFWTNVPGAPTSQNGSAYTPNNYAILSLAGGTPATGVKIDETTSPSDIPNEFIKVAQGFIVEMKGTPPTGTTPNTAILKFDNSIRTNNSTGHFYNSKNSQNGINRYWLKLTSPFNIVNTILVAHMDGATNQYDPDYDADLLSIGDDSFYSKLNTQKLQIQARSNPLTTEDVIPLGNKYSVNGNYKISLGNKEGIFAGDQKIYLFDKLNNLYTDLSVQDYIFTASKGTDDTRFEIVYRNQEVLGTDNTGKSDFSVYRDGTSFVIRSSFSLGKIELYDASGKLVMATSSNQKEFRLDAAAIASGVYIIRAQNSGNIRTKKIIK